MLARALTILFFLLQVPATPHREPWIDHNEVWIDTNAGPRRITSDGLPKQFLVLSPDRTRLAYLVSRRPPDVPQKQQADEEQIVVEIGADGTRIRDIIPKGYIPGALERLEWIDNRRIGAMTCGHANCEYWVLDAASGETLKDVMGGFDFIWSHNGRWVARRNVGSFGDERGRSGEFDELVIDEREVYPAPDSSDYVALHTPPSHTPLHGHSFGSFTWSPRDVWVGFTDRQSPESEVYVVAANSSGTVLSAKVPGKIASDDVKWSDDTHLRVVTVQGTVDFLIDKDKIGALTPTPR